MSNKLIGGLIITGITTIGSIIYGAIKTNQNNNLKQKNNDTNKQNEGLKKKNDEIIKQNEELKKENKDITKRNEELKKENNLYREEEFKKEQEEIKKQKEKADIINFDFNDLDNTDDMESI